jgi:predicted nucleic acid-binding protein
MCKREIKHNGKSQIGMRYLLETNICVTYLNSRLTVVRDRLRSLIPLVNNLISVAHNTLEVERVDGLQLEDWEVEI